MRSKSTNYAGRILVVDKVRQLKENQVLRVQSLVSAQQNIESTKNADFLKTYSMMIEGGREVVGEITLTANIYRDGENQLLPEFVDGNNYTWKRSDDPESFGEIHGKTITVTADDLISSPSVFTCVWKYEYDFTANIGVQFELSYGTIRQYAWSNALTEAELTDVPPSSWSDKKQDQPEDKKYLWRRESSDNGKSWTYFRETGEIGTSGWSTTTVQLFKRADTTPERFDGGTLTYTFSTATLSGDFGTWSKTIPTGEGDVYTCFATALSQSDTYDIAPTKWSDPAKISTEGNDGQPGLNVANIQLFQRSENQPSLPADTVTYNFETHTVSNTGSWSNTIPSGTLPLWTTLATASSRTASDIINPAEWSTPVIYAKNGEDGVGIQSITYYYGKSSSQTQQPESWSTTLPVLDSEYKYLWSYNVTLFTDGSSDESEKGIIGNFSVDGDVGNGIQSITYYYQVSASNSIPPSTWLEEVPELTTTNKYLWSYYEIEYTNGDTVTSTKSVVGVYGDKGDPGTDAQLLTIASDLQAFHIQADGTPYPDEVATVTVTKQGIEEDTVWDVPNHVIPDNTVEKKFTAYDMGWGLPIRLKNLLTENTDDWIAGKTEYEMSNIVQEGRTYYLRTTMKLTEDVVGITRFDSSFFYSNNQEIYLTPRYSNNFPEVDEEVTCSLCFTFTESLQTNRTFRVAFVAVIRDGSVTFPNIASHKHDMFVDVTELLTMFHNFASLSDADKAKILDTLPYASAGEDVVIGGKLVNDVPAPYEWGMYSGTEKEQVGNETKVTASTENLAIYYNKIYDTTHLYYLRAKLRSESENCKFKLNIAPTNSIGSGFNGRINLYDITGEIEESRIGYPKKTTYNPKLYLMNRQTTGIESEVYISNEVLAPDLTSSGWHTMFLLLGFTSLTEIQAWMDANVPYFSGSMDFPKLKSLPVSVSAGSHFASTSIGYVQDGTDGISITSVKEYYAVSSSNTDAPTEWQDTPPNTTITNKYLWNYEKITYSDGTTSETAKRVIGTYGDTGKGISAITNYYLVSNKSSGVTTSTSGWTTGIQTVTADKPYLWNYEKVTYTDDTSTTTTPVIIGTYSKPGADAKLLNLTTDNNIFRLKSDGTPYDNQQAVITVNKQGISEDTTFVASNGMPIADNSTEITVTPYSAGMAKAKLINVLPDGVVGNSDYYGITSSILDATHIVVENNGLRMTDVPFSNGYFMSTLFRVNLDLDTLKNAIEKTGLVLFFDCKEFSVVYNDGYSDLTHYIFAGIDYKYITTSGTEKTYNAREQIAISQGDRICFFFDKNFFETTFYPSDFKSFSESPDIRINIMIWTNVSGSSQSFSAFFDNIQYIIPSVNLEDAFPYFASLSDSAKVDILKTLPYFEGEFTLGGTLENIAPELNLNNYKNDRLSTTLTLSDDKIIAHTDTNEIEQPLIQCIFTNQSSSKWFISSKVKYTEISENFTLRENFIQGYSFYRPTGDYGWFYSDAQTPTLNEELRHVWVADGTPTYIRFLYTRFSPYGYPVTAEMRQPMLCDLISSGWYTLFKLLGFITDAEIESWMYANIPYFPDTYDFPSFDTLQITAQAGSYSDAVTIGSVRDGQQGEQGTSAKDFSIVSSVDSYTMSSRSYVIKQQTVIFACNKINLDESLIPEWELTVKAGSLITLSATSGNSVTVTIPVGVDETSFKITCTLEGLGTRDITINGIPAGEPKGVYCGMFPQGDQDKPKFTEQGPIITGDFYVDSTTMITYRYQYESDSWIVADNTTDDFGYIMSTVAPDIFSSGKIDNVVALGQFAFYKNVIANFISTQQIELYGKGIISSQGYNKGDWEKDTAKTGFYGDSSGHFEATDMKAKRFTAINAEIVGIIDSDALTTVDKIPNINSDVIKNEYKTYWDNSTYGEDIQEWTAISNINVNAIYSICYGAGKYVAVGYNGKGSYSTDGITWTAISDMKFGTSHIHSICYGNGKYVAVGNNGKGSYSADGVTWTAISDMKFGTSLIYSICYGAGKYVAVGYNGKGSYSTDGITWTAISDMKLGTPYAYSICYGNGKYVAVGNNGKGSYSTDGVTWTAISDMKFGTYPIESICYGNGKYVAVGYNRQGSYSTDGITWTSISDMKFKEGLTFLENIIICICYGADKYVAVGYNGKGSYSTDGITWTAISDMKFGTPYAYSICYGNGMFISGGDNNSMSYNFLYDYIPISTFFSSIIPKIDTTKISVPSSEPLLREKSVSGTFNYSDGSIKNLIAMKVSTTELMLVYTDGELLFNSSNKLRWPLVINNLVISEIDATAEIGNTYPKDSNTNLGSEDKPFENGYFNNFSLNAPDGSDGSLKAQNGYTYLPNGMILQWGKINHSTSSNTKTITFLKKFSTIPSLVVTPVSSVNSNVSQRTIVIREDVSNIDARIVFSANTDYGLHWIAIGY